MNVKTNRLRFAGAAMTLGLTLAACGGSDGADTAAETPAGTDTATEAPAAGGDDAGADTFGAGCAAVPADGAGSFSGMVGDPVATAASNNPVLSTLVAAVTAADLGNTLNSAEGITVFAPANSAFEAIPEADLNALLADKDALTGVLTYHVIGERIAPEDLAGTFETLQGGEVTVEGSGEAFTVGSMDANIICGNVQTANATVYIIDSVLSPA